MTGAGLVLAASMVVCAAGVGFGKHVPAAAAATASVMVGVVMCTWTVAATVDL